MKGGSPQPTPPRAGADPGLPSVRSRELLVRPALLRVRPQPGALPQEEHQELQQTLPLLPQILLLVTEAGMRGWRTRPGSAGGIALRPHGPRESCCKFINGKINSVLKPSRSPESCCRESEKSPAFLNVICPKLRKNSVSVLASLGLQPAGRGGVWPAREGA